VSRVPHQPAPDDVADALLRASRALVGVAARSLTELPDGVTIPQLRVLVLLEGGPLTAGTLAARLGVHHSTGTRLVDRLVAKRYVKRRDLGPDRRATYLELAAAGRRVVDRVTAARREAMETIVERIPPTERDGVLRAMACFAEAAGEHAVDAWSLGWTAVGEDDGPDAAAGRG
jgi:DNA-binding MarR family transcriptional regulator